MEPIEIFKSLKPVDITSFFNCFSKFSNNAFRLEMLDIYNVSGELEEYQKFLKGEPPPLNANEDWVGIINEACEREAKMKRVRLARKPFSTYLKYEVAWGYHASQNAGEDISVIITNTLPSFKTSVPILKDYWLFDDQECYLLEYDFIGTFLGINKVPDSLIESYVKLKEETISLSTPIRETEIWGLGSECK
ncbi:MAG: hypothetical protein KKA54_11445 [Proteobacteria bacterium]|nr:hypothetical protein [Pseudomonadota bacterium]